jgi:hypothetical protein
MYARYKATFSIYHIVNQVLYSQPNFVIQLHDRILFTTSATVIKLLAFFTTKTKLLMELSYIRRINCSFPIPAAEDAHCWSAKLCLFALVPS